MLSLISAHLSSRVMDYLGSTRKSGMSPAFSKRSSIGGHAPWTVCAMLFGFVLGELWSMGHHVLLLRGAWGASGRRADGGRTMADSRVSPTRTFLFRIY